VIASTFAVRERGDVASEKILGIPAESDLLQRRGQRWKPVRLFSPTARPPLIAVSSTSPMWHA